MDVHISRTAPRVSSSRPHLMALASLAALIVLTLGGCAATSASLAGLHSPAVLAPSTSTPRSGPVTWDALCQNILDISALTVTRTADSPANHLSFGVPTVNSTAGSAPARSVARTICSLAAVPAGTIYYCPFDWMVSYQFAFTLPGSARVVVDADPSGCAWATLAGAQGAPMRRTTPAFWSGLGTALGLHGATERSFVGTPPN